jgi:hypothetical protein
MAMTPSRLNRVTVADHADHPVVLVHDRDHAYSMLGQNPCGIWHG